MLLVPDAGDGGVAVVAPGDAADVAAEDGDSLAEGALAGEDGATRPGAGCDAEGVAACEDAGAADGCATGCAATSACAPGVGASAPRVASSRAIVLVSPTSPALAEA